ncbi:MAG: arylsulfatase [Methanomassiliicoccaceae archaeon]|jgi:arylsulfatase A-like enzyme|nr:arylsulfatase [Methanomassiliicoccaceae archaeon]HQD87267.1 arylsulfatase [Methanomassiliicoccaceae archaeon]
MSDRFKGTIGIDIRESVPDWEKFEQPKAPEGSPNILFIVWDDVGFGAMEPFGGSIETPTMERLAENGISYSQFHTTALCSPTRACLLTGRNHTTVGMACIEEASTGFPGSSGRIPNETATLAEVLVERGYNTYALGKWHLVPEEEANMASSKRNWPTGRGFERFYGFLGGETSQWYPDLTYDNHMIEPPAKPEEGYHLSKDLADQAIKMIRDSKQVAPDKPFFMFLCPGCAHAPHQVWKEWADRYRGKFDDGYEKYREVTLERQKKMGLLPPETELTPINPLIEEKGPDGQEWPALDTVRPWDSLTDDEKRLFARMAEVYAGFVSYTDDQIGRIIDYLAESGQLDNTIIVALSDKGASGEGGPNGSVNENLFFNGIPDDISNNLKHIDDLGGVGTYNHYTTGWATAFCTPFKMFKRYAAWSGGTCDMLIVSWPKGIKGRGIRHQYHHVIDIMPTILDCLGMSMPDSVKGYTQWPLEGVSMRYTFDDAHAPTLKDFQYYSMLGSRGIWRKGWKASTTHPTLSDWGHFGQDHWELYHTDVDRSESRDLAAEHPEILEELKALWFAAAGRFSGLPIDDRGVVELLTTPRPHLAGKVYRATYFPGTDPVPEAVAPNILNRSYKIGALVDIPPTGSEGVLFHEGTRFGGHVLYIKEGHLNYSYNFVGMETITITSDEEVPAGKDIILAAVFDKEGEEAGGAAFGTLTLYINEEKVGEGRIRTQPSRFGLGSYITVGRAYGAGVIEDLPGEHPWTFTGTIDRVTIDISGRQYVDLEKEARAILARI